MTTEQTETVLPLTHPDGTPTEPWELRDAIALTIHQLFDLRNPATTRTLPLPEMPGYRPDGEMTIADPYTGWLLGSLAIEVHPGPREALTITATAEHDN